MYKFIGLTLWSEYGGTPWDEIKEEFTLGTKRDHSSLSAWTSLPGDLYPTGGDAFFEVDIYRSAT